MGRLRLIFVAWAATSCLSAPPQPADDGGTSEGDGGGVDDPLDPCTDPARHGNVLSYAFEQSLVPLVAHDGSSNRYDAAVYGGVWAAGPMGMALGHSGTTDMAIPDHNGLVLDNRLTVEAWVRPTQADRVHTIVSDYDDESDSAEPDQVEVHVALDLDGRLLFRTNVDGVVEQRISDLVFDTGEWAHAAVTWDGQRVRFYKNAQPGKSHGLVGTPQTTNSRWHVGRVHDQPAGQDPFVGLVDEVRVSGCPKTRAQIERSMNSAEIAPCGNGLIEAAESCEVGSVCCDAQCAATEAGECGQGVPGECTAGGECTSGAATLPPENELARYEFNENGGTTAGDSVGPLDIDVTGFGWTAGGLVVEPADGSGSAVATALTDECSSSGEVSIDLWVTADQESGPGLIAGLAAELGPDSPGPTAAIGQIDDWFVGAVRSSRTDELAGPVIDSWPSDADGDRHHVVLTRAANGRKSLYVDGVLRGHNLSPGGLGGWGTARVYIGGRPGDGGSWSGTLWRLAIYCRALSFAEVVQSYRTMPD